MNIASLERVDFQPKSALATKMITACQAAMDEIKASRPNDNTEFVMATAARLNKATKMLQKSLVPELVKICKEELNLAIEVYLEQYPVYLNASTYTDYKAYSKGYDWIHVVEGQALFSGTSTQDPETYDRDYFKKFSENVDLEVSKLKTYTTEHVTYLWLFTSTFMTDEIVNPAVLSSVTAEEMASVILHELGHAMTILEHMGDVYNRSETATNTIKYLNEKADDTSLTTAVSEIKSQSEQVPSDVEKATDILSRVKSKMSNFAPVIAIILGFYYMILLFTRYEIASVYGKINVKFKKTSDTVVTLSNQSYMERIADEFVSRHGLGLALATALSRSTKYYELGHTYDTFSETVKAFGMIRASLLSFKIITDFLSPLLYLDDGTYDPDWLRIEHILNNNMVVFKDENLDQETRTYFIKQTKELIDLVDKFKNRKTFKMKQLIWGTIFNILSRTSISDAFTTANLSNDYDKLQLLTNGLVKNRLYLHAARLKNL